MINLEKILNRKSASPVNFEDVPAFFSKFEDVGK